MTKLEKNSIQFDYFSSNYKEFEEDFYKYANINIPLTFLTDDILTLMISTKKDYFRLNSSHSKDSKDHYFIFKKHFHKDNKEVTSFEYIGHCCDDKHEKIERMLHTLQRKERET